MSDVPRPTLPEKTAKDSQRFTFTLDATCIPEYWPYHFQQLGMFLFSIPTEDEAAFSDAMRQLRSFLTDWDEAIGAYEEASWDGADWVPDWYNEEAGWKRDAETLDEDEDNDEELVFVRQCLYHLADQDDLPTAFDLKVDLLLALFSNPWPVHIEVMLNILTRRGY